MTKSPTQEIVNLLTASKAVAERYFAQGLTSPDEVCFSIMAKKDRKKVARELHEKGLSTRDIAKITGASHPTIVRDIKESTNGSNEPLSGSNEPLSGSNDTKDASNKKNTREPQGPSLPKQNHPLDPLDRCTMAVRSCVLEATRNVPPERWDELFAAIRDELADVERTAKGRDSE